MSKVLVYGGRKFKNYKRICTVLDFCHSRFKWTRFVCGGAAGADRLALAWAKTRKFPSENLEVFMADWDKYGLGAGPIRNQEMLDNSCPQFSVGFPGGTGTADMESRLRSFGVEAEYNFFEDAVILQLR